MCIRDRYRGEIKTQFKEISEGVTDFYAKFCVDHYFKQNNIYSAFDTETSTPSYTLLSAGIGADIKAFGKKDFFNLYLSGENLANVAYQNHLSRLKYAPENLATGRVGAVSYTHLDVYKRQVKDSDSNEPIKNVTIALTDLKKSINTDENGNYSFQNLKEGKYFMEISQSNYSTLLVSVEVKKDSIANFKLQKSAKEIAEVVVTAVTRASELKKIPVVIKSVDFKNINQNASTNIIDGLKNIPGVNQITTGAAISKPVIRGLGYNSCLLYTSRCV